MSEQENKTYYRNTFDEVHASEYLLRKVEAMEKNGENKLWKRTLRKGWAAAAAVAVLLISSNIISYAATGRHWIVTVVMPGGQEKEILIGGQPEEVESADDTGKFTADSEDIQAAAPESEEVSVKSSETENDSVYSLETAGDRVYLMMDGQRCADITEDIKDGSCAGTFEIGDVTYCYEVTGTPEEYDINVITVAFDTTLSHSKPQICG